MSENQICEFINVFNLNIENLLEKGYFISDELSTELNTKWKLELDVTSSDDRGMNKVEVYLYLINSDVKYISTECRVILDNQVNGEDMRLSQHLLNFKNTIKAKVGLVSVDIWPDSVLKIRCEICYTLHQVEYYNRVILHGYRMDFGSLLKCNLLTDFTVIVNQREFAVHSVVLAARSTYFYALFTNDMKEKIESKITLLDIEAPVFESMLNFIYYGDLSGIVTLTEKLFIAADSYGVRDLRELCKPRVFQFLTAENVLEAFKLSDLYCLDELWKKRSVNFIIENYAILKLALDLDFEGFISKNPKLILLLLDKLII